MKRAILALADGTTFEGRSFGAAGEATGEVVFNTSMTGYQEILTDPSYVGQIVSHGVPGAWELRREPPPTRSRSRPHATGFIVQNFAEEPSNFRAERGARRLPRAATASSGIAGIDTRRLTRHLRTHGAQMGVIATRAAAPTALVERARAPPGMEGHGPRDPHLDGRSRTPGPRPAPTRGRTPARPARRRRASTSSPTTTGSSARCCGSSRTRAAG